MKTLVIVSHPKISESATQNFLKASFINDAQLMWHEITENIDVDQERQLLLKYDRIVFQFPLYWYTAPTALRKWFDEVLDGDFVFNGRTPLKNKEFGLVISTGISRQQFQAGGQENVSISEMLKPFEMSAKKLQMEYIRPLMIYQFEYYTDDQKYRLVTEYQRYLMQDKFTFINEIDWFIKELTNREEILLADTLKSKKDELDNLSWQVKTIREDDGEG